jgi:hypothetical protein
MKRSENGQHFDSANENANSSGPSSPWCGGPVWTTTAFVECVLRCVGAGDSQIAVIPSAPPHSPDADLKKFYETIDQAPTAIGEEPLSSTSALRRCPSRPCLPLPVRSFPGPLNGQYRFYVDLTSGRMDIKQIRQCFPDLFAAMIGLPFRSARVMNRYARIDGRESAPHRWL